MTKLQLTNLIDNIDSLTYDQLVDTLYSIGFDTIADWNMSELRYHLEAHYQYQLDELKQIRMTQFLKLNNNITKEKL